MEEHCVYILLASHNGSRYIKEQLDSVLHQSYEHIRLVIGDDLSRDGTREILADYQKRYPAKIRLSLRNRAFGVKENFMGLLEEVKAEAAYIMFCDQDDVWHKDKVKKSMERLELLEAEHGKNTPILLHTDLLVCDRHLRVLQPSMAKAQHFAEIKTFGGLLAENKVTGNTVLLNGALAKLALRYGVKETAEHIFMHDWYLALLASYCGILDYLDEPLVRYRQHESNVLGAQRKGWRRMIGTGHLQRAKENYRLMYRQAAFLLRFAEEFAEGEPDKTACLRAFAQMSGKSRWKKIQNCIRFGIYKAKPVGSLMQMLRM